MPKIGLGDAAAKMLLETLDGAKHRIRTGFGDSKETYSSDETSTVFGTGQGRGGSPNFWHAVSDVMFECIDKELTGLLLTNPSEKITSERNEDAFVDDTAMVADEREGDVVETLTHNSQVHERYLYATGGQLALHKCFWCLVSWQWEDGSAHLTVYDSDQSERDGTADTRVSIHQSQSGEREIIKRIGPHEAYRTLGAFISADGNFGVQLILLTRKTRDWSYKIRHSNLKNADRLLAYDTFLLPQVLFPIPFMYAVDIELRRAHRSGLEVALNALGVNRNYPRDIAYAIMTYFGL